MGWNTKISWTNATFNPWMGCAKVSPACDNCYAEARMDKRLHVVKWGADEPRKRTSEANWREPIKWNKEAAAKGSRYRVFCASLADVFDNKVPPAWRADLLQLIKDTPHLDWLLLTKRIGNAAAMLDEAAELMDSGMGVYAPSIYPNVWIGATICNQEEADRDIPKLLALPAAKRFLSMEPLLAQVDLSKIVLRRDGQLPNDLSRRLGDYVLPLTGSFADSPTIDWVIVGGESGTHARPMHLDWALSLRDQCFAAGTAFHFKQWGEWAPREPYDSELMESDENCGKWDGTMYRFGSAKAGRLLDGRAWDEAPA